VDGNITITKQENNIAVQLVGSAYNIGLHLGSGGTNRGIYEFSPADKWLMYFDASNTILNYGNVGIGTTSPSYKLHVAGTFYASGNTTIGGSLKAQEVEITGTNEINSNYGGGLHLQWSSSKNVTLCYGGGSVGIGRSDASYKLHVEGVIYSSTGVYSAGYVTALSDIRHKDIQGEVSLTVSDVANAPAVKFMWKDRRQEGLQVGSIAQYWQKVLPEAIVEGADGELTMSYGVIALIAAIKTARKVEDLERRVNLLEQENRLLKEQLKLV
jgi:hypothetical protein